MCDLVAIGAFGAAAALLFRRRLSAQQDRRFQSALRGGLTAPGRGAGPRPGKNRIDHVAGDAASEGILLARVKAAEH
jgi:hypothetical protein